MKVRACFECCTRDGDGNVEDAFGLTMTVGESGQEIDYQRLTASINEEGVLQAVCLDGIVSPEDVKVITPREYDEKYGDDEEAAP